MTNLPFNNLNSMINSKLILIGILFATSILNAQDSDYVITKNKDTIYGKINWNFHYIITSKEKKKLKLTSNTINECYIHKKNIFFESNGFNEYGKSNFRKRIVSGKINIYASILGETTTQYFVKKNDSSFVLFTNFLFHNKKRHKLTRKLIKDRLSIVREFDKMKGNIKNIKYIIEKYNEN
ncbi:hypothetical protein PG911_07925 [Tenacibaculum ovolyticum]|uniref:hypothetical protein n=1 Tax=Tenacibaculum ovolyticum TaxID=104270 RepID=UPI0022F3BCAC|nr:hypothetical protein [Tenacibaculum ovolyticum]WBX78169.1 hypothetical protein PG911_07925 [Tenacibaculum ovolyticum]